MRQSEFEALLTEARLAFTRASQGYGVAYSVVLQVPTEIILEKGGVVRSIRYQSDWLTWEPAEFVHLTPERARQQIERSRSLMAHAATTQQGRLADEDVPRVAMPVQKVVRQKTTVNYPAH